MNRSRRKGIFLIEILMALPIILLVFSIGIDLLRTTLAVDTNDAASADRSAHIESAINRLRADVWSADRINVTDPQSLEITHGPEIIQWTIATDDSLHRGKQQWQSLAHDWTFAANGPSLLLTAQTPQGTCQIHLASQVLLAGGLP